MTSNEFNRNKARYAHGSYRGVNESLRGYRRLNEADEEYDDVPEVLTQKWVRSNIPEGVTRVVIPQGVKGLGSFCFAYNKSLREITIPDSVTSMEAGVFYDCPSLNSIVIPDGVTEIENGTFRECSSLESVVIPDGVTYIGKEAFKDCSSLKSVVIPDSVAWIGSYAFYGCTSLESVVMPDSATSIRECAFDRCSSLKSIVIPNGVTSIGDYTFRGCSSLESVTIPNSVTSIWNGAFQKCSSLKSVVIPDGVTRIEEDAFRGCPVLRSVTIPLSVTRMGDYCFSGCGSLKDIYYGGTKADRDRIWISGRNDRTLRCATWHCKDGVVGGGARKDNSGEIQKLREKAQEIYDTLRDAYDVATSDPGVFWGTDEDAYELAYRTKHHDREDPEYDPSGDIEDYCGYGVEDIEDIIEELKELGADEYVIEEVEEIHYKADCLSCEV